MSNISIVILFALFIFWEINVFAQNSYDDLVEVGRLHTGDTVAIEISNDRRLLIHGSTSRGLTIIDPLTNTVLKQLPLGLLYFDLASNRELIVVTMPDELIIQSPDTISMESNIRYDLALDNITPHKAIFINQGQEVLLSDMNGQLHIFSADPIQKMTTWDAHSSFIVDIIYDEITNQIVTYGSDGVLKLWDASGFLIRELGVFDGVTTFTIAQPNKLVMAIEDESLVSIDLLSGEEQGQLNIDVQLNAITYSAAFDMLVGVSNDGLLRFWDLNTNTLVNSVLLNSLEYLQALFVSTNGDVLVGGITDDIYLIDQNQNVSIVPLPMAPRHNFLVTPDGKYVVIASYDSTLRIWSTQHSEWIYFDSSPLLSNVVYSDETNLIVGITEDGVLHTWQLEPEIMKINQYSLNVTLPSLYAISGTSYVAVQGNSVVQIVDSSSGQLVNQLDTSGLSLNSIIKSNDYLIMGIFNQSIRFWSLSNDFTELPTLEIIPMFGNPQVKNGFDDEHIFVDRGLSKNSPFEDGIEYWQIPSDGSTPILEWVYEDEILSFDVIPSEYSVVIGNALGFQLYSFDSQGNILSNYFYPVLGIDEIMTSESGGIIVTRTNGSELIVWQKL